MLLYPDHLSIKRVELAWWGYEVIGLAPLLRHLASNGMIQLDDYTNYGMSARFKSAAMGLEFIPVRDHGGSDMEWVNRGMMVKSPFTGENTYLVPACYPDVGLLHVSAADIYGNCRIFGALCTCPEIAMASTHNIVTAETIISNESIRTYPNLTEIPFMTVDAVIEQPFGAYPGVCYGFYWFDMEHIQIFRRASEEYRKFGETKHLQTYYEDYIFSCENFTDFLTSVGFGDGSADFRKKAGVMGSGPYRVITHEALFGFDEETRRMLLLEISPEHTPEQIQEKVSFEMLFSPNLMPMRQPSKEDLRLLREVCDPEGYFLKRKVE